MKIAAAEAMWHTEQPASFSLFQIGGFSKSDQDPSVDVEVPKLLSFLATGSFNGKVEGLLPLQKQEQRKFGPGNYMPNIEVCYWAMRTMAYIGTLLAAVAVVGAFFYRRRTLESHRWFLRTGVVAMFLPFVAATAGWLLTEMGRQPWIVQDLLQTSKANSPSVSTAAIGTSIGVFALLYVALLAVDFMLMRRYARVDPPEPPGATAEPAAPAVSY
jgi:cytochrome d ubiquinol oxidase subunit I